MLHRTLLALVLPTFALASCSEPSSSVTDTNAQMPEATAPADARFPELAAAFAELERQYPRHDFYPNAYYDAKLAAGLDARGEAPLDLSGETIFDIVQCSEPVTDAESGHTIDGRFDAMAIDMVALERSFAASGYTEDVYRQALLDYERRALQLAGEMSFGPSDEGPTYEASPEIMRLEAAEREAFQALARDAEARRAQLQPDQPRIEAQGGCGEGESPVYVRTSPPNGRVWMIVPHAFYKCALRTRTPWDRNSCRWPEVSPQVPVEISGRRLYQAEWPDGRSKRGDYTFGYTDEGAAEEGVLPIVTVTP